MSAATPEAGPESPGTGVASTRAPASTGPGDGARTPRTALAAAILVGMLAGLGGYTVVYAEGLAYLSNDPTACANCHVMREQLDGWQKGVHHAAATCNDCHVPQPFFEKYLAKALNGYHHSSAFTFQPRVPDAPGARLAFEEPIRIKPTNAAVLQQNCLRCHGELVHEIVSSWDGASTPRAAHRGSTDATEATRCAQCHRSVGHAGAR